LLSKLEIMNIIIYMDIKNIRKLNLFVEDGIESYIHWYTKRPTYGTDYFQVIISYDLLVRLRDLKG